MEVCRHVAQTLHHLLNHVQLHTSGSNFKHWMFITSWFSFSVIFPPWQVYTCEVNEDINQVGVEEIEWPELSPDLNPSQHLLDELER